MTRDLEGGFWSFQRAAWVQGDWPGTWGHHQLHNGGSSSEMVTRREWSGFLKDGWLLV